MTEYRELTEEEKSLYEKVRLRESERITVSSWDLEASQGMLERGLMAKFIADKQRYESMVKNIKKELEEAEFVLADAEKKLLLGVEIKEGVDE